MDLHSARLELQHAKSAVQANKTGVLYKHKRHVSGQSAAVELHLTYMMNGLINHSRLSLVASVEVSDEILFCIVANALLSVSSLQSRTLLPLPKFSPLKKSRTLKGESHVLCMSAYTMAPK